MLEQELKKLILSKFKSVKGFSEKANIPYTTVDSILKRGVGNANVINIIKMCQALNIDTDALSEGQIKPRIENVNSLISKHEDNIIKKYRNLDEYGQEAIDNLLNTEYKRCSETSSEDDKYTMFIAARSKDGQSPMRIEKGNKEQYEDLLNAPETDMDL